MTQSNSKPRRRIKPLTIFGILGIFGILTVFGMLRILGIFGIFGILRTFRIFGILRILVVLVVLGIRGRTYSYFQAFPDMDDVVGNSLPRRVRARKYLARTSRYAAPERRDP